jgi:hypothetical protein
MTVKHAVAVLGALLLISACREPTIPDYNNPSIEGLEQKPTRVAVGAAASGLIRGARDNTATFLLTLGVFGREGYTLNVANGTLPTYLIGPLGPGEFLVPGIWAGQYRNIRTANVLLGALDKVPDMTQAEKEATRGFVQTMQAYDFVQLIATRDTFGIPIDVNRSPTGPPAPIATRQQAYTHVFNLLDSATTHLQNGGGAFPFDLTSGFAGFDTPLTFLKFNRALRARASIYYQQWSDALTALAESFLDVNAPLGLGPSFVYTTNSGDETNPLFQPFIYAHPRILSEAQTRADGTPDLRAQRKVIQVVPFSLGGVTTNLQFTLYNSPTAPIPIIRNEELILLRAEANLALGNRSAAIQDLNVVRTRSGGLAPLPDPYAGDLLTELLYEKRYSLVWESGDAWLDMRRYGRLAQLPKAVPTHHIFDVMPFPLDECQARTPQPAGCTFVVGY